MDKRTNILLVEDDPNLGNVLKEYLELKGFDVKLCEDGAKGYSTFRSNNGFDLAILDVMMPEKDGFTLANDIRSKDTVIPIIFLTAKSMNLDEPGEG